MFASRRRIGLLFFLFLKPVNRPRIQSSRVARHNAYKEKHWILCVSSFVLLCAAGLRFFLRKNTVNTVRGPPNPSRLLGHHSLLRHAKAGELEQRWAKEYGLTYRLAGVFGEPFLMVIDPKALQYIFNFGYNFPKSREAEHVGASMLGPGLVTVGGQQHRRQRRILNPAFSESQLRQFLPLLQYMSIKVVQKLHEDLKDDRKVVNVLKWTHKVALDIIGIASFRHYFDTMDGAKSELAETMHDLLAEAQLNPSTLDNILFHGVFRHSPSALVGLLEKFPSKEARRFGKFRRRMAATAKEIYDQEVKAIEKGHDENILQKDIVSLLALSSLSEDKRKRLDHIEIAAQMATFIFAGHDTTAAAMGWLLYELAAHPEDQAKIRQEIFDVLDSGSFTANVYDSLPFLNAAIKESLRLHHFVHTLFRSAEVDDILPLSEPITTTDGRIITEIPVHKGQLIHTSIYGYNRLPSVWGADAEEWNPSRFLNTEKSERPSIGVYSNLLSFSSGVRGCIWSRFAIMEMQIVITELLKAFEFALPDDGLNLQQAASFQVLFPMIEGRFEEGSQIPLKISAVKREKHEVV